MLGDLHGQYGVCGQIMVPPEAFASHPGDTWVDRVLRAMQTLGIGLLMLSLVYACAHAHLPEVQWAGWRWVTRSYTITGRDICVLSRPRTEVVVRSLTHPANDLLGADLLCHVPGRWAAQFEDCHKHHLHLLNTGVGPTMVVHAWLTGLKAMFEHQLPSPPTHRLLHPVRQKKATKHTRTSTTGDTYVIGHYRDEDWNMECPAMSMDAFDGHREDPPSIPLLTPEAGGGMDPPPMWVVHGAPAFDKACAAVLGSAEWVIVLLVLAGTTHDAYETPVLEVVRMVNVPHDPHVAIGSLREGGAVEQGTVVIYQPHGSMAVLGAEFVTALEAINSICGCDIH